MDVLARMGGYADWEHRGHSDEVWHKLVWPSALIPWANLLSSSLVIYFPSFWWQEVWPARTDRIFSLLFNCLFSLSSLAPWVCYKLCRQVIYLNHRFQKKSREITCTVHYIQSIFTSRECQIKYSAVLFCLELYTGGNVNGPWDPLLLPPTLFQLHCTFSYVHSFLSVSMSLFLPMCPELKGR